eukprot:3460116-Karenia_brevis.AAC.1
MLDLVKAFERVPYRWLAAQGIKYSYPMTVLRLSIAAYRLGRCIIINGLCSTIVVPTRGITAGAVHATIELRLLLIEWLDNLVQRHMHIVLTVYVDDTTLEATGSKQLVADTVVAAGAEFTEQLIGM